MKESIERNGTGSFHANCKKCGKEFIGKSEKQADAKARCHLMRVHTRKGRRGAKLGAELGAKSRRETRSQKVDQHFNSRLVLDAISSIPPFSTQVPHDQIGSMPPLEAIACFRVGCGFPIGILMKMFQDKEITVCPSCGQNLSVFKTFLKVGEIMEGTSVTNT